MSGFQSGVSGSYGGVASGQTADDDGDSGPGLIGQILSSRLVGLRIARAGISSAEEEFKRQSEEEAAADHGDVDKYIKVQHDEFSGVIGDVRDGVKTTFDNLASPANSGLRSVVAAATFGEIAPRANDASEESIEQGATKIKQLDRKIKGEERDAKLEDHIGEMNEGVLEAGTQGSEDRSAERRNYEHKKAVEDADKVEGQSDDDFESPQAHKKIVAQMRDAADRKQGVEEYKAETEQGDRVMGLEHEVKEADMRMSGDDAGAKRMRFTDSLDKRSQEEHSKSQKEGDIFDQQVKPELIKQYDQQVAGQRAADEAETQDKVTKIQADAELSRLRASGNSYEAERDAKMLSLNEQVAATQQAADNEVDAVKKAQLQKVATATAQAAYTEGQDFQTQHDRQDSEGAAVSALKFAGDDEDVEKFQAAKQFGATGNKQEYAEKQDEIAYRADQQQHERDTQERDSGYRASGKGEMANYDELREREAENIRKAEMTGDKDRVGQAQRTASNDIKAYEKEHQEKPQVFGSTEDYANHIMMSGYSNDSGRADALKMAGKDAKDLDSGKGLAAMDKSAESLNKSAQKLGEVVEGLKKLFDKAPRFTIANVT